MANEVGRINRKIKAAVKRLVDGEPNAMYKVLELAREREEALKPKLFPPRSVDD